MSLLTRPERIQCRPCLAIVCAALLRMTAWSATAAADLPRDHAEFYVDAYGLADPVTEPRLAHTNRVFDRIRAAAAVQGRRLPRLKVLAAATAPWAQALPDGTILLSRGALGVCYHAADESLGDARLAFILGHELAHLAKDDFWHTEVYRALAGDPRAADNRRLLAATSDAETSGGKPVRSEEARLKESEADDWGFVYAAVAGYPVQRLLGESDSGDQDFFRFWVEQTHTLDLADEVHPAPSDRATLLRSRLSRMLGAIEQWRFGVRLLHFGRLDDARYFLEAFQGDFPSREVLGNLGYLYVRKALAVMPAPMAKRYWMPDLFDLTTRAEALERSTSRGATESLPSEAADFLRTATDYLGRAVALDPGYTPAWTNLAIARYWLGEFHLARDAADRALAGSPEDPELGALQAIIIAGCDPSLDLWPQAVARLDALLEAHPDAPAVRFNLARLLDERGRGAAALPHWTWLRSHRAELPAPYAQAVCDRNTEEDQPCPMATVETVPIPWDLPVRPGADLYEDKGIASVLGSANWQQMPVEFGSQRLHGSINWQAGRSAVLVLDGFVDTIALYGPNLGTASDLRARTSQPRSVHGLPGGEVWSYTGWAAVIREGRVAEVWIEKPSR